MNINQLSSHLNYPKAYPKGLAGRKVNYEELDSLWKLLSQREEIDAKRAEVYRRILLLGKSFELEMSPLAEKLYNTWLFGPNGRPFSQSTNESSVRMNKNFGSTMAFGTEPSRPWLKIDWSKIQSEAVNKIRLHAIEMAKITISSGELPEMAISQIKSEIKKSNKDSGRFGTFETNSLEKPTTYLMGPQEDWLSVSTSEQLWNEKKFGNAFLLGGNSLTSMLVLFLAKDMLLDKYSKSKMPDVISSLGGFNMYVYGSGTFKKETFGNKKVFRLNFERLGLRIVDPYDFNNWQKLSCWYPESGHDISKVKFSYDVTHAVTSNSVAALIASAVAFNSCSISNADFRDFKVNILNKFNALANSYQLICMDYYVVTPIYQTNVNIKYEIEA
ncbi:MAG: hypothetical protein RLO12_04350 [Fulvivirga sp.]